MLCQLRQKIAMLCKLCNLCISLKNLVPTTFYIVSNVSNVSYVV